MIFFFFFSGEMGWGLYAHQVGRNHTKWRGKSRTIYTNERQLTECHHSPTQGECSSAHLRKSYYSTPHSTISYFQLICNQIKQRMASIKSILLPTSFNQRFQNLPNTMPSFNNRQYHHIEKRTKQPNNNHNNHSQ